MAKKKLKKIGKKVKNSIKSSNKGGKMMRGSMPAMDRGHMMSVDKEMGKGMMGGKAKGMK